MGTLKNDETFPTQLTAPRNGEWSAIAISNVEKKADPSFTEIISQHFQNYSKTLVLVKTWGEKQEKVMHLFMESLLLMLSLDVILFFQLYGSILG